MYHITLGLMISLTALQPTAGQEDGRFEVAQLYGWGPGYGFNNAYGYNNYGYNRPYYQRPYYYAPRYNAPYGYNNYTPQPSPYQTPYYNAPAPQEEPYQPYQAPYQPAPQEMTEGEAPPESTEEVPRARNPVQTPTPTPGLRTTATPPTPRTRETIVPEGEASPEPEVRPASPPPIPMRMPDAQTVTERRESLKQFDAQRRALQLRRQAAAQEDAKIHILAPGETAASDLSRETVTIEVVFTGHSFAAKGGEKLYLAGVRTPFFAVFEGVKPQPGGKEAYTFSQQRTKGIEVQVVDDAPLTASSGKRSVYLFLPDGTLLNAELLKLGLAKVDNAHPFARQAEFQRLEGQARAQRSGLWK